MLDSEQAFYVTVKNWPQPKQGLMERDSPAYIGSSKPSSRSKTTPLGAANEPFTDTRICPCKDKAH